MARFVAGEWILLADRLPTVEEVQSNEVFICTDGFGVYVREYSYRMRGFVTVKNGREVMERGIVAWMALPEPYRGDND